VRKAKSWWERRTDLPFPATAHEAIKSAPFLLRPHKLQVDMAPKYPNILAFKLD
jgi:hypothetical protein